MDWVHDVHVKNTPLSTTGGHTWKAAYRLADYLAAAAPQLGLAAPGVRVLELGAGTGWLGATLARNLPAAALVCLTEQEGGLHWLRHNLELNRARGLPLAHVHVLACDWLEYAAAAPGEQPGGTSSSGRGTASLPGSGPGPCLQGDGLVAGGSSCSNGDVGSPRSIGLEARCREAGEHSLRETAAAAAGACLPSPPPSDSDWPILDLRSVEWDFIVGSDLIYNEVGSCCLPRVLAALAGPATQVLYCHTKHRYDLLDMEFFEELAGCGLRSEEVWEPCAIPPPESPPLQFPPLDLFPEQRIAVYRITKPAT